MPSRTYVRDLFYFTALSSLIFLSTDDRKNFSLMAEREGVSFFVPTISANLVFSLYHTITTEGFSEYVRDERDSLKQESDT